MRVRNLSNSPYEMPIEGGGQVIVPALGVSGDVEPSRHFLDRMNPAFWRIEDEAAPTPAPDITTPIPDDDMSRDAMIEKLEAAGVEVDGRWGDARLARMVEEIAE